MQLHVTSASEKMGGGDYPPDSSPKMGGPSDVAS